MKIWIFIISILLNLQCTTQADMDERETEQMNDFMFKLILIQQKDSIPQISFKDLKNGMVQYETSENTYYKKLLIKKCLQGQVYRKNENDCRGTGNASNNYGAQLLQFCDKTDDSCLNSRRVLSGNGNSEAFNSCDSETMSHPDFNEKWMLIGSDYFIEILLKRYNLNEMFPDIPPDAKFWLGYADNSLNALYSSFSISKLKLSEPGFYPSDSQTNRKYVLCFKE